MDKKFKQHRQKTASDEDLEDLAPPQADVPPSTAPVAPPGASFDTEEGRAAQGMRKDLGKGPEPAEPPAKDAAQEEEEDEETHDNEI